MRHTQPIALAPRPQAQTQALPHAQTHSQARITATETSEQALMLLGPSVAMAQLWSNIRRLAPYVRCVLLTGEADCGQEAAARLLLELSPHSYRIFVKMPAAQAEQQLLRCTSPASLPADIFLYLPDIHHFSLEAQEAVLRLLTVRRGRPVTIVASCSEDLSTLVALGRFLPALAEALGAVRIALPSLRERKEDLPMLLNQMLAAKREELGRATPEVTENFLVAAMQHTWPGNLRELGRTLTVLCSRVQATHLSGDDLQDTLPLTQTSRPATSQPARLLPLETVIQEHISGVLHSCRGNKLKAAEILGISRSTLYRMLEGPAAPTKAMLSMAS